MSPVPIARQASTAIHKERTMKTLEKFEADIIAFAVGTIAVMVLIAAFSMGAFACDNAGSNPGALCASRRAHCVCFTDSYGNRVCTWICD